MPALLLPPIAALSMLLQEEAPAEPAAGGSNFFVLVIALVAVFYFVMILPEKKNRKKREAMLSGLKKGDKVMTTSGMFGVVAMTKDDVVTLQVSDGVRLRFSRSAIQGVLDQDPEEKKAEEGKPAQGGAAS